MARIGATLLKSFILYKIVFRQGGPLKVKASPHIWSSAMDPNRIYAAGVYVLFGGGDLLFGFGFFEASYANVAILLTGIVLVTSDGEESYLLEFLAFLFLFMAIPQDHIMNVLTIPIAVLASRLLLKRIEFAGVSPKIFENRTQVWAAIAVINLMTFAALAPAAMSFF